MRPWIAVICRIICYRALQLHFFVVTVMTVEMYAMFSAADQSCLIIKLRVI